MTDISRENIEYLYLRLDTRWNSENLIKRNMHRSKIEKLVSLLEPGKSLLDVCRGGSVDGVLGVMAAKKGLKVTICNTKQEYLDVIKRFTEINNAPIEKYILCNPDDLNFPDNEFDYVSCIHVLEHVNAYDKAIEEMRRVSKKYAIFAFPTCLNISVFARIGGADYYNFNWKSLPCLFWGCLKVLFALITFREGVYENNEEKGKIIKHFQRFPWIIKRMLQKHGFKIIIYGADGFCFPWVVTLIKFQQRLDKYAYNKCLRNFGFGTHFLCEKKSSVVE